MSEFERILLECRYILSLNKSYNDLAGVFNISKEMVYNDLNIRLPNLDKALYKRIEHVLKEKNSS